MLRLLNYYGRFQGFRGNLNGMPRWARTIVAIFALPGLFLIGLSVLALVVSILALLLLTVPVYAALSALTSPRAPDVGEPAGADQEFVSPNRRHVDVKIIE